MTQTPFTVGTRISMLDGTYAGTVVEVTHGVAYAAGPDGYFVVSKLYRKSLVWECPYEVHS